MIDTIENKIEAYKIAVEHRVRTYMSFHHSLDDSHPAHIEACIEAEKLKLDDLLSTIHKEVRNDTRAT